MMSNDGSDDDGYSTTFLIVLVVCTSVASMVLAAISSVFSYRHINRRSLSKPLLTSDQFGDGDDVKYGVVSTNERGESEGVSA